MGFDRTIAKKATKKFSGDFKSSIDEPDHFEIYITSFIGAQFDLREISDEIVVCFITENDKNSLTSA